MAVITDLTFQQLLDQLPANSFTVAAGKVTLDLSVLTGNTIDGLTDKGVIKALNLLLDAAQKAQAAVNVGQAVGERLAAFPVPNFGNVANGYATTTRTFVSRSEVATAVNIIGQVA